MLLSLILTIWEEKSKYQFLGYILFAIFQMLLTIAIYRNNKLNISNLRKINNRNRRRYEIHSKLIIKTP